MYCNVKKFRVIQTFFKFIFQRLKSKFLKKKFLKNVRITPTFFFTLQYIKNWTKVANFKFFFLLAKKILLVHTWFENFTLCDPICRLSNYGDSGPLGSDLWCWVSLVWPITIGLPLDIDCLFTGCIIYHCFFTGCIIYWLLIHRLLI